MLPEQVAVWEEAIANYDGNPSRLKAIVATVREILDDSNFDAAFNLSKALLYQPVELDSFLRARLHTYCALAGPGEDAETSLRIASRYIEAVVELAPQDEIAKAWQQKIARIQSKIKTVYVELEDSDDESDGESIGESDVESAGESKGKPEAEPSGPVVSTLPLRSASSRDQVKPPIPKLFTQLSAATAAEPIVSLESMLGDMPSEVPVTQPVEAEESRKGESRKEESHRKSVEKQSTHKKSVEEQRIDEQGIDEQGAGEKSLKTKERGDTGEQKQKLRRTLSKLTPSLRRAAANNSFRLGEGSAGTLKKARSRLSLFEVFKQGEEGVSGQDSNEQKTAAEQKDGNGGRGK